MTGLDIHIIQNMPPNCLNRDENNLPKSCMFAGKNRGRISSQCWKRAARFSEAFMNFSNEAGMPLASRSRRLPKRIYDILVNKDFGYDYSDEEAKDKALEITKIIIDIKDDKKTKERDISEIQTKATLFLSDFEVEQIVAIAHKHNYNKRDFKKAWRDLCNVPAPDVALNGRMVASTNDMNINAASSWAHSISTNQIEVEFDFFATVDEFQLDGEIGADHTDFSGFNSPCYYRLIHVNIQDLYEKYESLGDETKELVTNMIIEYLAATIYSIPSAKQNSMASYILPSMVYVEIGEDVETPISAVNAFAKPIQPTQNKSVIQNSIEAFANYRGRLETMKRHRDKGTVKQIIHEIEESDLKELSDKRVEDINVLFDKVEKEIERILKNLAVKNEEGIGA